MADVFSQINALKLMENKTTWFLGDSNVRALYKDLLCLLESNKLILEKQLKTKLEQRFMNDTLITSSSLGRGRSYVEDRKYHNPNLKTTVEFMFLTKCFNDALKEKLEKLKPEDSPDAIIICSCLWDICRWGPNGVKLYKENVLKLLQLMKEKLPPTTLVLWLTSPPVASHIRGGVIIKQLEFIQQSVRFDIMEGNLFIREQVGTYGYDLLDIHYHMLLQLHRRNSDGVHWTSVAVRFITNLILTHLALSWRQELPGNFKNAIMQKILDSTAKEVADDNKEVLANLQTMAEPKKASAKPAPKTNSRNNSRPFRSRRRQNEYHPYNHRNYNYYNSNNNNNVNNNFQSWPWLPNGRDPNYYPFY